MKYARPPFPIPLYERFKAVSNKLRWDGIGQKWELLERLLDYAEENPSLFAKR